MNQCFSRACALVVFLFATVTPMAWAARIIAIESLGTPERPAGTVLTFDSNDPGNTLILGDIGLKSVGAMDYRQGVLWAADCSGNILRFYTLDLVNMQARLVSTAHGQDATYTYGGSLDAQGRFWISNNIMRCLYCYDPFTGQQLATVPFNNPNRIIPAIAFAGPTLYALSVATQPSPSSGLGILDPATGVFTQVISAPSGGAQGLDYDPMSRKLFFTFAVNTDFYEADFETGTYRTVGHINPDSTLAAIAVMEEMPPIIVDIEPAPERAIAGEGYTRQLRTSQGTIPLTWTLVAGPPDAVIDADGSLTGWTPTLADMNMTFTFEVEVRNTLGADTKSWQATVRSRMDFDRDGDVDQLDFGHLQVCLTGALTPLTEPKCQDADLDADSHIDQGDLMLFLGCLSGPDVPPGPNCVN